jgi:hypothetical protein
LQRGFGRKPKQRANRQPKEIVEALTAMFDEGAADITKRIQAGSARAALVQQREAGRLPATMAIPGVAYINSLFSRLSAANKKRANLPSAT